MKKRKKPYLLITLASLFFLVIAGINMKNMGLFDKSEAQQEPPPPPKETGSVREDMEQKLKGLRKGIPIPGPNRPDAPGQPTVKVQKQDKYVPKPSDSATSAQWYTDDAADNKK